VLDVDTVIFAIGDRVDENFGLPVGGNEFLKNPDPKFPVEGISYEAYNPDYCCPLDGVFVAGWSRKASTGLVGIARKDGTNGAKAIAMYLQTLPPPNPLPLDAVHDFIHNLGKPVVTQADLARLQEAAMRKCWQH
jgi:ferredoxin--NADP+ reductase